MVKEVVTTMMVKFHIPGTCDHVVRNLQMLPIFMLSVALFRVEVREKQLLGQPRATHAQNVTRLCLRGNRW